MATDSAALAQLKNEAALTTSGQSKVAQASSASYVAANPAAPTTTPNPATQQLQAEGKLTQAGKPAAASSSSASYIAGTQQPNPTAALAQQSGLTSSGQAGNAQAADRGFRSLTWTPPPPVMPPPVVAKPNPVVQAPSVYSSDQAKTQDQTASQRFSNANANINTNNIGTNTNTGTTTPAAAGATTTPPASTTPATPADQVNAQLQAVNDKLDAFSQNYQDTVTSILNGTFVLSPTDQATLGAIQTATDQAVANQKLVNDNLSGAVTETGIRNGLQRYAPEVNAGILHATLTAGAAAIAKIEADGQTQLSTARQAMETNDMTLLNDSMDAFDKTMTAKSNTIQQMYTNTLDYQKFTADQAKQAADAAATSVDALTKAGVQSSSLSKDQLAALDAKSGYEPGTTAALLDAGYAQTQAKDQSTKIDNATKLIDTLTKSSQLAKA